mmetsp:Transcript_16683/g.37562  ORF Transcript_16683/g.37562 Transcript_16683/m.37562 type:complete len:467 (+) Transcript_16683:110-1510(+)
MLPQGPSWVAGFDAFRTVPKDLAEASVTGAFMTMVSVIVCTVLFLCETSAFMTSKPTTRVMIDSNQDALLRINFDVHMLDMACDFVTVGVWDAFGTERMNITRNVQKQRIDHKGSRKGHPYSEDELTELEFSDKSFTKEELSELDADWGSSSDHFKHDDFQAVVDAHDFTMVNFYADWCPHCRQFGPTWKVFEDKVNDGQDPIKDADGVTTNVRVLKINCVDFEETCQEQSVQSFPTIRLYKRSSKEKEWKEFNGPRKIEALSGWLRSEVGQRHLHSGAMYHEMFNEGCRISGYLEVARVPGTVHFQATHTNEKTLNLAFTNVSHKVYHFSFGEAPRQSMNALPSEYRRQVNPLDGRDFIVDKFHKAPNHFIKVVHTRFETTGIRSYQQTHQSSIRTLQRNTIPQAKFSYDLSPVEVVVSKGERRWYDFLTQVFAIIGGAFSVMSMATGVIKLSSVHMKGMLNKLG